jgi:signal transduction histidine kinase
MPDVAMKPGRDTLKLLVVEDSDDDYALLTHHLQRSGLRFDTTRAADAPQLREAVKRNDWDLVISDHQLPGFSSVECLATVREARIHAPFIIVSGAIGESVAVDAMLAGADDYVMKGKLARLVPAIERGLRASVERRRREASEARLAAIAQNLPGVLMQMEYSIESREIRLPFISEGTLPLFGVEARTLMNNPGRIVHAIHPVDVPRFLEHLSGAARDHTGLEWQGRVLPDSAGHARWIQIVASPRPRPGDSGRLAWDGLVMDITALKETEDALLQSREQLRDLSAHLEEAKESERSEISRELHDEIGGLLTGLKVDLSALARRPGNDAEQGARLADMERLTDEMAQCARRIARRLRPAILDQSLPAALEWLARDFQERTAIRCTFTCNDEELDVAAAPANAIFRAVQESLTNVMRHARAKRVEVHLFKAEGELSVEVRDDGVGLAEGARGKRESFGLRGMEERITSLRGWLEISNPPGGGTTVMLGVPLQ